MSTLSSNIKIIIQTIDQSSKEFDKITAAWKRMNVEALASKEAFKGLSGYFSRIGTTAGKAEKSLSGLAGKTASVKKAFDGLGTSAKSVGDGMSRANDGMKKFSKTAKDADKTSKSAGTSIGGLAGQLTQLAASAVAILLPIKEAAAFERAMSEVKAISGATAKEFENLESTALEMGRTTEFTSVESAQGLKMLTMAGLSAVEAVGALPEVLNLSMASGAGLGETADILTNIMSGFRKEVSELRDVSNSLTYVFTHSNTTLQELGQAMSYVAPVAASLGVDFDELSTAMGIVANSGIKATRAGTGTRQMLSKLIKPAAEAKTLMRELGERIGQTGIEIYDAEGKFKSIADIISQFERANLSAAESMKIFGLRAGPTFTSLLAGGSESLRERTAATKEAKDITEAIAKVMTDNFAGAIKKVESAFSGLMIELGDRFLPMLKAMALGFADFVTNITTVIDGMGGFGTALITVAVGFGVYAAAAKVATLATALFATTLGTVVALFGAFVVGGVIGSAIRDVKIFGTSVDELAQILIGNLFIAFEKVSAAVKFFATGAKDSFYSVVSGASSMVLGLVELLDKIPGVDKSDEIAQIQAVIEKYDGLKKQAKDAYGIINDNMAKSIKFHEEVIENTEIEMELKDLQIKQDDLLIKKEEERKEKTAEATKEITAEIKKQSDASADLSKRLTQQQNDFDETAKRAKVSLKIIETSLKALSESEWAAIDLDPMVQEYEEALQTIELDQEQSDQRKADRSREIQADSMSRRIELTEGALNAELENIDKFASRELAIREASTEDYVESAEGRKRAESKLADDIAKLNKGTAEKKIAAYTRAQSAIEKELNAGLKLEKDIAGELKSLHESIADAKKSGEEKIRDLRRDSMSAEKAYQDELAQVNEKYAEGIALIDTDATKAISLIKEAMSQAGSLGSEVSENGKIIVSQGQATQNAIGLVEKGTAALEQAEKSRTATLKNSLKDVQTHNEKSKASLDDVNDSLADMRKVFEKGLNVTIKLEMGDFQKEITDLTKTRETIINVSANLDASKKQLKELATTKQELEKKITVEIDAKYDPLINGVKNAMNELKKLQGFSPIDEVKLDADVKRYSDATDTIENKHKTFMEALDQREEEGLISYDEYTKAKAQLNVEFLAETVALYTTMAEEIGVTYGEDTDAYRNAIDTKIKAEKDLESARKATAAVPSAPIATASTSAAGPSRTTTTSSSPLSDAVETSQKSELKVVSDGAKAMESYWAKQIKDRDDYKKGTEEITDVTKDATNATKVMGSTTASATDETDALSDAVSGLSDNLAGVAENLNEMASSLLDAIGGSSADFEAMAGTSIASIDKISAEFRKLGSVSTEAGMENAGAWIESSEAILADAQETTDALKDEYEELTEKRKEINDSIIEIEQNTATIISDLKLGELEGVEKNNALKLKAQEQYAKGVELLARGEYEAAKEAFTAAQDAYVQMVEAAKDYADEILAVQERNADVLISIRDKDLSDEEKWLKSKQDAQETYAQAIESVNAGQYEQAAELFEQARDLAADLVKEVEDYSAQILGIEASTQDAIRSLQQGLMSDEQKWYSDREAANAAFKDAQTALDAGEYESAEAFFLDAQKMAQDLARTVTDASGNTIMEVSETTGLAISLVEKAGTGAAKAITQLQDETQAKAVESNAFALGMIEDSATGAVDALTTAQAESDRIVADGMAGIQQSGDSATDSMKKLEQATAQQQAVLSASMIQAGESMKELADLIKGLVTDMEEPVTISMDVSPAKAALAELRDEAYAVAVEMEKNVQKQQQMIKATGTTKGDSFLRQLQSDAKKANNELDRLNNKLDDTNNTDIMINFKGIGSSELPLSEKIIEMEKHITDFGETVSETDPEVTTTFKANAGGQDMSFIKTTEGMEGVLERFAQKIRDIEGEDVNIKFYGEGSTKSGLSTKVVELTDKVEKFVGGIRDAKPELVTEFSATVNGVKQSFSKAMTAVGGSMQVFKKLDETTIKPTIDYTELITASEHATKKLNAQDQLRVANEQMTQEKAGENAIEREIEHLRKVKKIREKEVKSAKAIYGKDSDEYKTAAKGKMDAEIDLANKTTELAEYSVDVKKNTEKIKQELAEETARKRKELLDAEYAELQNFNDQILAGLEQIHEKESKINELRSAQGLLSERDSDITDMKQELKSREDILKYAREEYALAKRLYGLKSDEAVTAKQAISEAAHELEMKQIDAQILAVENYREIQLESIEATETAIQEKYDIELKGLSASKTEQEEKLKLYEAESDAIKSAYEESKKVYEATIAQADAYTTKANEVRTSATAELAAFDQTGQTDEEAWQSQRKQAQELETQAQRQSAFGNKEGAAELYKESGDLYKDLAREVKDENGVIIQSLDESLQKIKTSFEDARMAEANMYTQLGDAGKKTAQAQEKEMLDLAGQYEAFNEQIDDTTEAVETLQEKIDELDVSLSTAIESLGAQKTEAAEGKVKLPKFHTGGYVDSDMTADLAGGEYVMQSDAVGAVGEATMAAINAIATRGQKSYDLPTSLLSGAASRIGGGSTGQGAMDKMIVELSNGVGQSSSGEYSKSEKDNFLDLLRDARLVSY